MQKIREITFHKKNKQKSAIWWDSTLSHLIALFSILRGQQHVDGMYDYCTMLYSGKEFLYGPNNKHDVRLLTNETERDF